MWVKQSTHSLKTRSINRNPHNLETHRVFRIALQVFLGLIVLVLDYTYQTVYHEGIVRVARKAYTIPTIQYDHYSLITISYQLSSQNICCFCYSMRSQPHKVWMRITSVQELLRVKMLKMSLILQQMQACVKYVTTRKLNVSFYHVVMPELVKSVLQELKIQASHVLIVVNPFQQPTGYTCNHVPIIKASLIVIDSVDLCTR